jgi:hypothetical protein
VDDCDLKRVLELLAYARRENEGKSSKSETGQQEEAPPTTWTPPTEAIAESQFALTQAMVPPGLVGREARIPEHYREAIRWAEFEKEKRGLH